MAIRVDGTLMMTITVSDVMAWASLSAKVPSRMSLSQCWPMGRATGTREAHVRPLRRAFVALRTDPVLDYSCLRPLLDESQDPLVRDSVPEELSQPLVINFGEKVRDVRV